MTSNYQTTKAPCVNRVWSDLLFQLSGMTLGVKMTVTVYLGRWLSTTRGLAAHYSPFYWKWGENQKVKKKNSLVLVDCDKTIS